MLERNDTVLIVTDIQGKLATLMHERESLYRNAAILIRGCKALDIPILWAEQYPEGLGPTVPEIAAHLDGYSPIAKKAFSSLRDSTFRDAFDALGKGGTILTGIETHVCIHRTALDLIDRGVETHVAADAVSSRTAFNKKVGLDKIRQAGGWITSAETALFELIDVAEGAVFKEISRLVK